MTTIDFAPGGYRYVPGVFQYSAGVAALPGHRFERVTFREPLALAAAFARIESTLAAAGRPFTAFAACELRSPRPMTEAEFRAFNERYVERLSTWGVIVEGRNPVARSNVCPAIAPPAEPAFHAFTYTVEAGDSRPSFVVAGSGEVPEGRANYRDHVVRPGDVSPEGLREKARFVLGAMEERMAALGFGWRDATATQVYTVHDLHPFLADEIVGRGAARLGLTWHYCRPPVAGLDYEMDCRAVAVERID